MTDRTYTAAEYEEQRDIARTAVRLLAEERDETPVTEGRLRGLGFRETPRGLFQLGFLTVYSRESGWCAHVAGPVGSVPLASVGQLLALIRGLGIEPKR